MTTKGSAFTPYRGLGLIGSNVPFSLSRGGNGALNDLLTISSGYSFQSFTCTKLKLIFVGPEHKKKIRALTSHDDYVFTATQNNIFVWKRGALVRTLRGHNSRIRQLFLFGEHLLSLDQKGVLKMWSLSAVTKKKDDTQKLSKESTVGDSDEDKEHGENNEDGDDDAVEAEDEIVFPSNLTVTCIEHPQTYLNKILVGTEEGVLQLWNIRTKKLIYNFNGWNSAVTCIQQSPAVDVVGIALANGTIVLHNIRYDKVVLRFSSSSATGSTTSLSFRSDGKGVLASGSDRGEVALWDLENQKLITVMKEVHEGPISRICFLQGQPLLITSGATDNSLKIWIFDSTDSAVETSSAGRLLKERSGHSQPPTFLRFYGTSGHHLLSAGDDKTLRFFSTIQEHQNRELSQGSRLSKKAHKLKVSVSSLKLPTIIAFDSSPVKEREWDNIVTCHKGDRRAYTWNFEKLSIGKHSLATRDPRLEARVSAVAISSCGNFALVGTTHGWVDKFNMQSGRHCDSCKPFAHIHTSAITGICVDSVNRFIITGGLDKRIKFWDFHKMTIVGGLLIGTGVTKMIVNKDSELLAVLCDDFVVRVYDIDTQRIVRRYIGHTNQLTDLAFSTDGRWIVTSSMDSTIRVWDLPSGKLINWFQVKKAVTSLAFSPTGEYLAAAHLGRVGVYLYVNNVHFTNVFMNTTEQPVSIALPTSSGVALEDNEKSKKRKAIDDVVDEDAVLLQETSQHRPLGSGLVTYSNAPRPTWLTLYNLETIKERNKPKQPPKKPEAAPFFLKTLPGIEPKFAVDDTDATIEAALKKTEAASKIINLSDVTIRTKLMTLIKNNKYEEAIQELSKMSPSGIDVEIRSINTDNYLLGGGDDDSSIEDLGDLLRFIEIGLTGNGSSGHKNDGGGRDNFELLQSVLNLTLKVHGDVVAAHPKLHQLSSTLLRYEKTSWNHLENLLNNALCLVSYFSGTQL